jgi:hypothetical protein
MHITAPRAGTALRAGPAIALLCLACGSGMAATPIYKCVGPDMRVLYTDVPCSNGERLDIRAGDADPDAVSKVERERDALARSATQRIEDERRASTTRQVAAESVDSRSRNVSADDSPGYYPYGWGWAPSHRDKRPRFADAPPPERPRDRPYIVPKQPPRPPRK